MNIVARIFNLFQRRPAVKVIMRDQCRLRLNDWRSDNSAVTQARAILAQQVTRSMIDVLRTECYANYQMGPRASIEDRACMQARAEGYISCLNNLEAMGIFQTTPEPLEATFEPPEQEKE